MGAQLPLTPESQTMIKLSQQQLAILASAHAQPEGFATRPSNLKPSAALRVVTKLIEQALIREMRSKGDAPVWREDAEGKRFSLKILKAGRMAVLARTEPSVEDKGPGLRGEVSPGDGAAPASVGKRLGEAAGSPARSLCDDPGTRKGQTKRALIVSLMGRDGGATLDDLIAATGWLPHTTRAALTGLRKSGFAITRCRNDDGRASIYRIGPATVSAAA